MGKEEKVTEVLKIGLNEKNEVIVYGQLDDKRMCLFVLIEAIKIVYDYEAPPKKIIKPRIVIPHG